MPDSSAMKELPLRVRNTFIEGCPSAVRSSSLEPFLRRRRAHSCPSSPVGTRQGTENDVAHSPRSTQVCESDTDVSLSCPSTSQQDWERSQNVQDWEGSQSTQDPHADAKTALAGLATPTWEEMPLCGDVFNVIPWSLGMANESVEPVFCAPDAMPTDAFWAGSCQNTEVSILQELGDYRYVTQQAVSDRLNDGPRLVLSLAEALGVLATSPTSRWCEAGRSLGTTGFARETSDAFSHIEEVAGPVAVADSKPVDCLPDLPSAGSAGHSVGLCKPCSFLHGAAGCRKGQACRFCHLCDAGVGRQHKKERMQRRKKLEFGSSNSWSVSDQDSRESVG